MALIKTGARTLRSFVITVRVVFVFHIVHTRISYSKHQYNVLITGGTGIFWYKLNDTTDGAFYLFLDEQWPLAAVDDNCTSKLAKARYKGTLINVIISVIDVWSMSSGFRAEARPAANSGVGSASLLVHIVCRTKLM